MTIRKDQIGSSRKLLKQYKSLLFSLSQIQKETAIGLSLGDVSLQTQSKNKLESRLNLNFEWGNLD